MRRVLLLLTLLLCGTFALHAQLNFQFHYNYGHQFYEQTKSGSDITTTIEYSGRDRWGSNYILVDFDYSHDNISRTYWEFERELQFWKGPISVRLEYCGSSLSHHMFDIGPTYTYLSPSKKSCLTATIMYLYNVGQTQKSSPKFSGFWMFDLAKSKVTLIGYLDAWEFSGFKFIAEPQLWVNLNAFKGVAKDFNLAIGGEVRVTYDLMLPDAWCAIPTVALKWHF